MGEGKGNADRRELRLCVVARPPICIAQSRSLLWSMTSNGSITLRRPAGTEREVVDELDPEIGDWMAEQDRIEDDAIPPDEGI
jgi:hypothetical protein